MALEHCRACGHRVSTTAPKCPGCGSASIQPVGDDHELTRFCTRCAARVRAHDPFCFSCGVRRESAQPALGQPLGAAPQQPQRTVEHSISAISAKEFDASQNTSAEALVPTLISNCRAAGNSPGFLLHKAELHKWLPGFRSRKTWKQCTAIVAYAWMSVILFHGVLIHDPLRIVFGLELFAGVLLVGNAWNLRSRIPLLNSSSALKRSTAWGMVTLCFLFLYVAFAFVHYYVEETPQIEAAKEPNGPADESNPARSETNRSKAKSCRSQFDLATTQIEVCRSAFDCAKTFDGLDAKHRKLMDESGLSCADQAIELMNSLPKPFADEYDRELWVKDNPQCPDLDSVCYARLESDVAEDKKTIQEKDAIEEKEKKEEAAETPGVVHYFHDSTEGDEDDDYSGIEVSDVEFSWAGDLDRCPGASRSPMSTEPTIYGEVSYTIKGGGPPMVPVLLQLYKGAEPTAVNGQDLVRLQGQYRGTITTQGVSPTIWKLDMRGPGKFVLSIPPGHPVAEEKYDAGPCD